MILCSNRKEYLAYVSGHYYWSVGVQNIFIVRSKVVVGEFNLHLNMPETDVQS